MTTKEFILFINILGFTETSSHNGDSTSFSMSTDVVGPPNQNLMAFADQLKILIDYKLELVQLSLSQMSSHMMSGKNFGNFSLKTFGNDGDFQLEIFLSFILGSFKKPPHHIVEYMRDRKIENILK